MAWIDTFFSTYQDRRGLHGQIVPYTGDQASEIAHWLFIGSEPTQGGENYSFKSGYDLSPQLKASVGLISLKDCSEILLAFRANIGAWEQGWKSWIQGGFAQGFGNKWTGGVLSTSFVNPELLDAVEDLFLMNAISRMYNKSLGKRRHDLRETWHDPRGRPHTHRLRTNEG